MSNDTKVLIGVLVASLALGATQIPQVISSQTKNAAIVASQTERTMQADKAQAREAARSVSVAIANARYDQGCEVIGALDRPGIATTIEENAPIVAGAFQKQAAKVPFEKMSRSWLLGRDVSVCDAYGTTAIMTWDDQKGYATAQDIAVTNDRARFAKAVNSRPGLQRPALIK
jgi:hypothetical protein